MSVLFAEDELFPQSHVPCSFTLRMWLSEIGYYSFFLGICVTILSPVTLKSITL